MCFLLALAFVTVMPAPAFQQIGNIGAPIVGPFAAMYDLATTFANFFPVAIQTGLQVVKNVANRMDHTILSLTGGNEGQSYGQTSILNGRQSNIVNDLGDGTSQNKQLNPIGNNPLSTKSNQLIPAVHPNSQSSSSTKNVVTKIIPKGSHTGSVATVSKTAHKHEKKKSTRKTS